jgi:glycosyltransferase involved in cell wall biosynthesis
VPGVGDILRDGLDGRIVPPRNDLALADGICEFVLGRENWPAMCREAHRRHQAEFSAQRLAAEMVDVYRSLV